MRKKLTLGLDIGIASVGWAILDKENKRIIDRGVRIFTAAEHPKDGSSLAAPRRKARGIRRRIRRKALRLRTMRQRLLDEGIWDSRQSMELIFHPSATEAGPAPWQLRAEGLDRCLAPQEWARVLLHIIKNRGFESNKKGASEAQDEEGKKTKEGLLQGVERTKNLLKEKGYRTPGEMIGKDSEFTAKKRNSNGNYRHTLDRVLIKNELELLFTRQREQNNPHASPEFQAFALKLFGGRRHYSKGPGKPSLYGGDLIKKMRGTCQFEPNEPRAPLAAYSNECFRRLSSLRHIKITEADSGRYRILTNDEVEKVSALETQKVTYKKLKQCLDLPESIHFKGLRYELSYKEINQAIWKGDQDFYRAHKEDKELVPQIASLLNGPKKLYKDSKVKPPKKLTEAEKKDSLKKLSLPEKIINSLLSLGKDCEASTFFEWKGIARLKAKMEKAQPSFWDSLMADYHRCLNTTPAPGKTTPLALIDRAAEIMTLYREDDLGRELEELGFPPPIIAVLENESFEKFKHLSFKVLYKILPYLEQGAVYSEACEQAGYDHSQNNEDYDIESINSPVVKRAVRQSIKVVEALNKKHGDFSFVYVENARDLSKGRKERDQIATGQQDFRKEKEQANAEFAERFGREPKGSESLKFRFYREQHSQCPYCGTSLDIARDVTDHSVLEIDHILPYSRSMDDSLNNKVLVCSPCNQNKRERTPFEFIAAGDQNSQSWREFKVRCAVFKRAKKERLLEQDFNERGNEYRERNLNDTRYISRFIHGYLKENLRLAEPPPGVKRQIYTVKGAATAVLRNVWGLNSLKYSYTEKKKTREKDGNHAVDALCIAAAGPALIQHVSKANRKDELYLSEVKGVGTVDKSTGELIENPGTAQRYTKKIRDLLPPPWENFRDEVEICIQSTQPRKELQKRDKKYAETEMKPLFCSRRVNRKQSGEVHKQTILSAKIPPEEGRPMVLRKLLLEKLTLKTLENMQGREDNGKPTALYQDLKQRLKEQGGDGKKAFAQPFHKRSKKGIGPVVKAIRVKEPLSGGVEVRGGKAESGNGAMLRVDVFHREGPVKKENGYYLVPIYLQDRLKSALPNRGIIQGKNESEWLEMREEEFHFSLYPNDLVELSSKEKKFRAYYIGTNRSTAAMTLENHDRSKIWPSAGAKTLQSFRKLYVDVLGQVYHAPEREARKPFEAIGN